MTALAANPLITEFTRKTAHVVAPFRTVAIALVAPPLLAGLLLAFVSSLGVSLAHGAGGPAPVYYGSHYVSCGGGGASAFSSE